MRRNYQKSVIKLMVTISLVVMFSVITKNVFGQTQMCVFGTLQNATPHLEQNYKAGMRRAILELNWSLYFPNEGEKNDNYISNMKGLIETYKNYGYDIMLDFGMQYAPAWIFDYSDSRFKNQYGDTYSGGPGENIVNAVFNGVMRQKQADYVQQVFADLGTDFSCIRIGWLRYGELGYPQYNYNGHSNTYWCYDDVAQKGGANLPEGITACPVSGWLPGQSSANHNDARNFYNWYVESLTNYQNWMLSTTRKYYQGLLCVLYPSWGTRPGAVNAAINVDLKGTTSPEINGEIQRAHDFQPLIGAIKDANVMVLCTWVDSNEEWSNDASSNQRDWSPVHWLANLAQTHSPALKVGGENSGGSDSKKLDLTFRRLKAYNLELLMWAFDSELYGGTFVSIDQYGDYISSYKETSSVDVKQIEMPDKSMEGETKLFHSNYPNPFNVDIVLSYQIPVTGNVSLKVYNAAGREVASLAEGVLEAGAYTVKYDGSSLKSGIFFAHLVITSSYTHKSFSQTLKLVKVN